MLKVKKGCENGLKHFPGTGDTNVNILVAVALRKQNAVMGLSKKERDNASLEQFGKALNSSDLIVDEIVQEIREAQSNA